MTGASNGKKDFFVSYNKADLPWAEWVGSTLEANGFSVLLSEWDAKGNFVTFMEEAHHRTERTVALLSDNYYGSDFTAGEWTARYARDPAGRKDILIPVIVGPISRPSLLDALIFADLFACGRDKEKARKLLLERIARATDPEFAQKKRKQHYAFPDLSNAAAERPRFPVPIHNLPLYNPDFVGREDVLARLHELMTTGQGPAVITRAITGLGGIGKSQTTLAYCYRHLADYEIVWWLRAERPETLGGQLALLAPYLGLDPTMPDQAKLVAQVLDALGRRGSFLLVFDNLEKPEALSDISPRTNGQVLLTARRQNWGGLARTLPLDVMPEPEALELLTGTKEWASLPDLAKAKTLAEELGYLPLALAQARAYMAETGKSLAGYLRLFRDSRPRVLDRKIRDYPVSVAKTWQISIEAAARVHPAAQSLLELLAFFAPDALPVKVLDAEPAILSEELYDEFERDEAIAALNRFSLIRAQAGTITVHRLVQAVTRDGLDTATAKARAEAAVRLVNLALPDQPQDPTTWPVVGVLLPHALVVAETAERLGASLEAAARVLNQTGLYHRARAAFAEAAPLFQRALAIHETALGPEHPDTATILSNLALLYQDQGRYDEAAPLYQRALATREAALGPEHPDTANSLNNLAGLYRTRGRLGEAEPLYRRALEIYEKALDPEHPDTATSLNNLAVLYRTRGRLGEAEPLYRRALTIREAALGPEHPDTAISLNNLALLYQDQGRYDEAAPLYQRALATREAALGPEHPDTANSLNNLAGLYRTRGRLGEAEPLYRRALAIWEKALGPEHPDTATSLNNLAALYRTRGRLGEAEPLYRRALTIREAALGPEHPDTAISLNNLAALYWALGRLGEAEPLYRRALEIYEKALDPAHPDTRTVRQNLMALRQHLSDHQPPTTSLPGTAP